MRHIRPRNGSAARSQRHSLGLKPALRSVIGIGPTALPSPPITGPGKMKITRGRSGPNRGRLSEDGAGSRGRI